MKKITEPKTGLIINIREPESREVPRSFLAWLSEYGFKALQNYLTTSGAPDEIIDLASALYEFSALQENDHSNPEFLGTAVAQLARGLHFSESELAGADSVFSA